MYTLEKYKKLHQTLTQYVNKLFTCRYYKHFNLA